MELLQEVIRAIFGIAVFIGFCYFISSDKKNINWSLVLRGIVLQLVLGLLILKVPIVSSIIDKIASFFTSILQFSSAGAEFIFGDLVTNKDTFGYVFAFQVLPTIIFMSALTALLYYLGILQKIVIGLAKIIRWFMPLSGPEVLSTAGNVFIGQTEAPLIIKPYLKGMNKSEVMCLMTGGMATISGSVFAAFVGFLGGDDPVQQQFFAKHLLTASIISAPAAILVSKIIVPQPKGSELNDSMEINEKLGSNILDALTIGTKDGLKLAVNVGAILIVFVALMHMCNQIIMNGPGSWFELNEMAYTTSNGSVEGFNLTYILGWLFAPLAWLLGVPWGDTLLMGQLLGQKTVLNEFVAYGQLSEIIETGKFLHQKTIIIATYALCGFANFGSIGVQIAGISAIAPGQRKNLTSLGLKSLVGGTIACFLTAIIAGIIV